MITVIDEIASKVKLIESRISLFLRSVIVANNRANIA